MCQNITVPTHNNGNYIDLQKIILFLMFYNISDHYALHASIPCSRPHKECKQIVFRQINKINHQSLYNDLTEIDFDFNETDIDIAVISYNAILILFIR